MTTHFSQPLPPEHAALLNRLAASRASIPALAADTDIPIADLLAWSAHPHIAPWITLLRAELARDTRQACLDTLTSLLTSNTLSPVETRRTVETTLRTLRAPTDQPTPRPPRPPRRQTPSILPDDIAPSGTPPDDTTFAAPFDSTPDTATTGAPSAHAEALQSLSRELIATTPQEDPTSRAHPETTQRSATPPAARTDTPAPIPDAAPPPSDPPTTTPTSTSTGTPTDTTTSSAAHTAAHSDLPDHASLAVPIHPAGDIKAPDLKPALADP